MNDSDFIKQTALNYIEGWYTGDSFRMEKALYPKLAKRRVLSEDESWEVNSEWMIKATQEGKGRVKNPEIAKREVKILDIKGKMASIRIDSEKFIDYLHLTKIGEEWFIVNVLWDYNL